MPQRITTKASNESFKEPTTSSKRKLSHVSKACLNCRRRKSRCDGVDPCATCKSSNLDCAYAQEIDRRRLLSRPLMDSLMANNAILKKQIEAAQALLEEHGISYATTVVGKIKNESDGSIADDDTMVEELASDEDEAQSAADAMTRLKLNGETGELHSYGATATPTEDYIPDRPESICSSVSPFGTDTNTAAIMASGSIASPPALNSPRKLSIEDTDWTRHLPLCIGEDPHLHESLLSLFMTYFNPWNCWVNEHFFRRDLAYCLGNPRPDELDPPERTSNYSSLLHNAILGLACYLSDDPRVSPSTETGADAIQQFKRFAKAALDKEVRQPLVSTVSGLMLLGSLCSGGGEQGEGYYFAGAGLRLSTALGLGIDSRNEFRKGIVSADMKATRERQFWCCYVQDKLWSVYVGRDDTISTSKFNVPLPPVLKEQDDIKWRSPPSSIRVSEDKVQILPSYYSTTFHHTCKLAMIAERIMNAIYALKVNLRSPKIEGVVSKLDVDLAMWKSELPPAIDISCFSARSHPAHVIMLHQMYWFLSILLHRPFFPRNRSARTLHSEAFISTAIRRCSDAATKIIQLLQLFRKVPTLRYAPVSLTQITFAAGTIQIFTAAYHSNAPAKATHAIETARSCVEFLREQPWACSAQAARNLEGRIQEQIAVGAVSEAARGSTSTNGHQPSVLAHLSTASEPSLKTNGDFPHGDFPLGDSTRIKRAVSFSSAGPSPLGRIICSPFPQPNQFEISRRPASSSPTTPSALHVGQNLAWRSNSFSSTSSLASSVPPPIPPSSSSYGVTSAQQYFQHQQQSQHHLQQSRSNSSLSSADDHSNARHGHHHHQQQQQQHVFPTYAKESSFSGLAVRNHNSTPPTLPFSSSHSGSIQEVPNYVNGLIVIRDNEEFCSEPGQMTFWDQRFDSLGPTSSGNLYGDAFDFDYSNTNSSRLGHHHSKSAGNSAWGAITGILSSTNESGSKTPLSASSSANGSLHHQQQSFASQQGYPQHQTGQQQEQSGQSQTQNGQQYITTDDSMAPIISPATSQSPVWNTPVY